MTLSDLKRRDARAHFFPEDRRTNALIKLLCKQKRLIRIDASTTKVKGTFDSKFLRPLHMFSQSNQTLPDDSKWVYAVYHAPGPSSGVWSQNFCSTNAERDLFAVYFLIFRRPQ